MKITKILLLMGALVLPSGLGAAEYRLAKLKNAVIAAEKSGKLDEVEKVYGEIAIQYPNEPGKVAKFVEMVYAGDPKAKIVALNPAQQKTLATFLNTSPKVAQVVKNVKAIKTIVKSLGLPTGDKVLDAQNAATGIIDTAALNAVVGAVGTGFTNVDNAVATGTTKANAKIAIIKAAAARLQALAIGVGTLLTAVTDAPVGDGAVGAITPILNLVNAAGANKTATELLITNKAKEYTDELAKLKVNPYNVADADVDNAITAIDNYRNARKGAVTEAAGTDAVLAAQNAATGIIGKAALGAVVGAVGTGFTNVGNAVVTGTTKANAKIAIIKAAAARLQALAIGVGTLLTAVTDAPVGDGAVGAITPILNLVNAAGANKTATELLITNKAKEYTDELAKLKVNPYNVADADVDNAITAINNYRDARKGAVTETGGKTKAGWLAEITATNATTGKIAIDAAVKAIAALPGDTLEFVQAVGIMGLVGLPNDRMLVDNGTLSANTGYANAGALGDALIDLYNKAIVANVANAIGIKGALEPLFAPGGAIQLAGKALP